MPEVEIKKVDIEHAEETTKELLHNMSMYNGAFDGDHTERAERLRYITRSIDTLQALIDEVAMENKKAEYAAKHEVTHEAPL